MRTHESKRKDYAPITSDSRSRWLALVGVALVARLCDTEAAGLQRSETMARKEGRSVPPENRAIQIKGENEMKTKNESGKMELSTAPPTYVHKIHAQVHESRLTFPNQVIFVNVSHTANLQ